MENNRKKTAAIAAVIIVIIIVAAAAFVVLSKDNERIGITDGTGRIVNIESSDRIATTSAIVTEIVCGLGGYSKLVGVTDDDRFDVDESILGVSDDGYPKSVLDGIENGTIVNFGGMYTISAEAILSAEPDMVIMGGYFNNDSTISQLEAMGVAVVVLYHEDSLDSIYLNIELVGKAIGKESEAKALVDKMKSAIGKIVDWTESLEVEPPSVAMYIGYGHEYGSFACGNEYLMGTPLMEMLGGTNAFSDLDELYAAVTTEALVSADPDVIIDSYPVSASVLNAIKTDPVAKSISAAENDRIYGTFGSSYSAFSATSQGFVNAVALTAMFMYEDQLDFELEHYMGSDYMEYLDLFWEQINS